MEYKIITIIITYFIWVYYVKKKKKLLSCYQLGYCVLLALLSVKREVLVPCLDFTTELMLQHIYVSLISALYIQRHNYYLGFKNNSSLC